MSTSITNFVPDIAISVLGCPKPIIEHCLVDIIRDFASKTLIYNSWIDLAVTSGTKDYTLSAPTGTEIVDVIRAVYDDSDEEEFTDFYFIANTFWITYEPTDDFDLDILVGLRPTRTSTEVEDIFYNDWLDVIVAGTLWKLCSMNKKDWSDPAKAQEQMLEYFVGVNKAKALAYERLFNNSGVTKQKSFI